LTQNIYMVREVGVQTRSHLCGISVCYKNKINAENETTVLCKSVVQRRVNSV
jgi:hypothetical protein